MKTHIDQTLTASSPLSKKGGGKAVWLKRLHQWHWISSAICLLGILLFSFTGITLNHSTQIESEPAVVNQKAVLPQALLSELRGLSETENPKAPLPENLKKWVHSTWHVNPEGQQPEWSSEEVNIAMPKPGGDAWIRISLQDGAAEYELTDRGWISWLNDLHKGRHTGSVWSWFIDIFAAGCFIFSITGLLILKFHAANRPFTWPIVGLGILIPLLLALLFIH